MDWTFLILLAVLWLVSPLILLIALIVARRQVRELREQLANRRAAEPPPTAPGPALSGAVMGGGAGRYAPVDLENLLLLRLELQRLVGAGTLSEERRRQLAGELDRLWERHLREGGAQPG
ncbi:MAG: hypothetical protein MZU84_05330 [Sphingobacterium sp.]|nr:hypothetical protein [Sphingobacterium sp.]